MKSANKNIKRPEIASDRDCDKLATEATRAGQRHELSVKGCPGLRVQATAKGNVSYILTKRLPGRKSPVRRKLGSRPALSLAMAKEKWKNTLRALEVGEAPLGIEPPATPGALTFRQCAELRFQSGSPLAPATIETYCLQMNKDVFPQIGDKQIDRITAKDVLAICEQIVARGASNNATRTKNAISSVFKWAVQNKHIEKNPCAGLPRWGKERARERTITDAELRALWHATDAGRDIGSTMRYILKACMLTCQRIRTVVGTRKSEFIGFDTGQPIWHIPHGEVIDNVSVTRTKSGKTQRLPVSRQAAYLLSLAASESAHEDFVFPSPRANTKRGHILSSSVTHDMIKLRKQFDLGDFVLHDLRRALSDNLGAMRVPPHVIDAVLHHTDGSTRAKHYPDAQREPEVRQAMQLWADRLAEMLASKPGKTELRWSDGNDDTQAQLARALARITELEAAR